MSQISVGSLKIDVVRKDIKNIHLAVYPPNGRVRLASPLRFKDDSLRLFVISKLPWIKRHQGKFKAQERESKREFVSGESHYLWGKKYILNVIKKNEKAKIIVRNKTHIDLYVRPAMSPEKKAEIIKEWYREEIKLEVERLILKWQKKTGVTPNSWQIKLMKTRWGSCNVEKKAILINLELCKKPINCLEYIIVHELVHLLERKHNKRFINYMDKFMPNWRLHRNELNTTILSYINWNY